MRVEYSDHGLEIIEVGERLFVIVAGLDRDALELASARVSIKHPKQQGTDDGGRLTQ